MFGPDSWRHNRLTLQFLDYANKDEISLQCFCAVFIIIIIISCHLLVQNADMPYSTLSTDVDPQLVF